MFPWDIRKRPELGEVEPRLPINAMSPLSLIFGLAKPVKIRPEVPAAVALVSMSFRRTPPEYTKIPDITACPEAKFDVKTMSPELLMAGHSRLPPNDRPDPSGRGWPETATGETTPSEIR